MLPSTAFSFLFSLALKCHLLRCANCRKKNPNVCNFVSTNHVIERSASAASSHVWFFLMIIFSFLFSHWSHILICTFFVLARWWQIWLNRFFFSVSTGTMHTTIRFFDRTQTAISHCCCINFPETLQLHFSDFFFVVVSLWKEKLRTKTTQVSAYLAEYIHIHSVVNFNLYLKFRLLFTTFAVFLLCIVIFVKYPFQRNGSMLFRFYHCLAAIKPSEFYFILETITYMWRRNN